MTENLNPEVEKLEFKELEPVVKAAIEKFHEERRHKTFSERHPELGRMINCQVCSRRHRESIKCVQNFKYLYTLEDTETGEKTDVFATATPHGEKPTYRQMIGAAVFKGKRRRPHPNAKNLQLIERTHQLYGNFEFDPKSEQDQADLKTARTQANRELRKNRKLRNRNIRRQEKLSRRINYGLASPGSRI